LDRRRKIARLAHSLRKEIELAGVGVGTEESEPVFLSHLRMLCNVDGIVRLPAWGQPPQGRPKRGGDRRSGLRSERGEVLGQIVRLYCEAHAKPRFSRQGPLVRFVNAVGELAFGKAKPFTPDAVKAEFRRMKLKARRTHQ
jgi:hypothetical protein